MPSGISREVAIKYSLSLTLCVGLCVCVCVCVLWFYISGDVIIFLRLICRRRCWKQNSKKISLDSNKNMTRLFRKYVSICVCVCVCMLVCACMHASVSACVHKAFHTQYQFLLYAIFETIIYSCFCHFSLDFRQKKSRVRGIKETLQNKVQGTRRISVKTWKEM